MAASHTLHHPWTSPPATVHAYATWLEGIGERRRSFLLWAEDEGDARTLVGTVNASEIVRGAFHSCYLGYYAFRPAAGRGLFTIGLSRVIDVLFDEEELHRVEANIQPGNARSLALVRRLGFRREGFSPDYLHIDGAWRDHERWALLATDPRPALQVSPDPPLG